MRGRWLAKLIRQSEGGERSIKPHVSLHSQQLHLLSSICVCIWIHLIVEYMYICTNFMIPPSYLKTLFLKDCFSSNWFFKNRCIQPAVHCKPRCQYLRNQTSAWLTGTICEVDVKSSVCSLAVFWGGKWSSLGLVWAPDWISLNPMTLSIKLCSFHFD